MNKTKTIIRLNATALRDSSCIRKLWFKVIEGYKGYRSKIEPDYGVAVHKIAETFVLTKDRMEAQQAGMRFLLEADSEIPKGKDYLNTMHLQMTGKYLMDAMADNPIFTNFEILTNPKTMLPLVEQQFSIPVYVDDDYEVFLQGTIDLIVKARGGNGAVVLRDYKTTSAKDKESFLRGFGLASQWRCYYAAVKLLTQLYPESPLATVLKNNPNIGCQNIGVFLDPKLPVSFGVSDIFWLTDQDVTEFMEWLLHKIVQPLVSYHRDGKLPTPEGTFNGTCQTPYGSGCPFAGLCTALPLVGVDGMKGLAERTFAVKVYEPLKVGGGKEIKK